LGKFVVYYDAPRELSLAEVAVAKALANHLAAAVARLTAIADLRQTVRFNDMFAGILGHDLRNPLAAIMMAAQLAAKRNESEPLFKPLARILTSGERMSRMIDQLLDFTRMRVGNGIRLEPRRFDLADLLRQMMDELDVANPDWALRLERAGD